MFFASSFVIIRYTHILKLSIWLFQLHGRGAVIAFMRENTSSQILAYVKYIINGFQILENMF